MNIILKMAFFHCAISLSCCWEKKETDTRSISKEIYNACKENDHKKIETIYKKHGINILNQKFQCSYHYYPEVQVGGYPIEFLSSCKHWDLLIKFINNGVSVDVKNNYYQNFLTRVAETQDQSKKKLFVLDALVKKNLDINALNIKITPASSPFFHYVKTNHKDIHHDDRIMHWFIENNVEMNGTKISNYNHHPIYMNNIFHNIIMACHPDLADATSIAKIVCFNVLKPVRQNLLTFLCCLKFLLVNKKNICFKMPKPVINIVITPVILESVHTQKIITALEQKIDLEKLPLDYFSSTHTHKHCVSQDLYDIIIYDAQEWKNNPIKQLISCAPPPKKK